MKKIGFLLLLLCGSLNIGWADQSDTQIHTQIQCELHRRERAVIPRGKDKFPHVKLFESTSSNWSGYAATTKNHNKAKGSVTNVAGSWTVPSLLSSVDTTYSSFWVGIDGYSSGTVEQIGTEHDFTSGTQQNYAWFEMYPQGSYEITGFPCDIGDQISATVSYLGSNTFQLTIHNNTKSVYTVIPHSYTKSSKALRSSAEWILEAPFSSQVLPLADFQTGVFTGCSATISGVTSNLNSSSWFIDCINMATNTGVIKALTSATTDGGQDFSVSWRHQ